MRTTPGRWVNAKFTPDQTQARKLWRRADNWESQLGDALKISIVASRKAAHEKVDRIFDRIENARTDAAALFPEVGDSFTIASFTL